MSRWREHWLRLGLAAMLAAILAALSFAAIKPLQADEASPVDAIGGATPQSNPYGAEVTDIYFSSDPVYAGDATIHVEVRNLSSTSGPFGGEATFALLLEVDPPGLGNTKTYRIDSISFSAPGETGAVQTFSMSYSFKQTLPGTRYRFKATVYNPDFTVKYAEDTKDISVNAVSYDAAVSDIRISPSSVYQGESASISAEFTNQVGSNSGEGTFDIVFVVDPPGDDAPVELEVTGSERNFSKNEPKRLGESYEFEHVGRHTIKAQIWNPDRSRKFGEVETTLDVKDPYGAQVTRIYFSSDPVYAGDATINVEVRNLSSTSGPFGGEATFALLLEVDPPGFNNTVTYELDSKSFSRPGRTSAVQTFSMSYSFKQTFLRTMYRFKAKVYNPDISVQYAEDTKDISVNAVSYDADVSAIRISPASVYQGESASISAMFTNQVRSNSGDGTFDIVFVIVKPDGGTEDIILDDQRFTRNQSRVRRATHPFSQSGEHTIRAEIWNQGRSERFAWTSTKFTVEPLPLPDLAVEIAEQVTPVVGNPLSVPLVLRNKGTSPSPEYEIRVVLGKPASGGLWGTASSLDPTGDEAVAGPAMRPGLMADYGLTFPSITMELEPGPHLLCVLIEYAGEHVDGDDSDNADCMAVYVLPDMGNDFPGEIQAFLHLDDYIQHRIGVDIDLSRHPGINIAGKLLSGEAIEETDLAVSPSTAAALGFGVLATARLEGEIGTGSEPFWVFVPTKYSTRYEDAEIKEETEKLAEEIVERTWKGLESRDDREDAYEKLALEIARRGQTYGNKFISVGVTEEDKKRFVMAVETLTNAGVNELPESAETLIEHGDQVVEAAKVVEAVLSNLNVNFEHVNLNVVHGHLESLPLEKVSNGLLAAKIVVATVGLADDIRITESLNRSIFVGQATKTLEILADLKVHDAAWSAAIDEAQKKLAKMTSKEGLQNWSAAIEENLPNIAATYSQMALQVVAAKLVTAAVTAALTAAGIASLPVAVIAVPVTVAVALAIDEIYEIVGETHKYWDGITLASMSTQVYSNISSTLIEGGQDDADRLATEEVADYLEFAFYKHLARASEANPDFAGVDIGVLGDGRLTHNKLKDEREAIFHERDQILSEVLGGDWDHTHDFKFLEDAKRPLDIWSDGTTMWAMDGQSLNDYLIYAFDMSDGNERADKKIQVRTEAAPFSFVDTVDLFKDAEPRGIWSSDDIMWVADHDFEGATKIFGYRISDESKVFEIPGEEGFSLPDAGIWSDGTTMWFASWTIDCGIVAYDVEKQMRNSRKDICDLAESNKRPYGLWSDGETMWVSDIDEGRIFAYSVRSGEQEPGVPAWGEREILKEIVTVKVIDVTEDSYPHIANNSSPTGIWSDGETMWVADRESDRIFAYSLPDSLSPPLSLTATVGETDGDSQVDLTWQAPSDTGRTAITGYVVEESEDGLAWQQLVGNTASTSTSYSDQRLMEWSVRHYRVAAINSSGAGPFSATVTAFRTFGIASIGCLPSFFYAGDPVECSPTIVGDSPGEFTYAWQAHDGAVSWDAAEGSTASVTWDSPGAKQLRVVACRIGNPTEYISTTLIDAGPASIDVGQASGGACAEATKTVYPADPTPTLAPDWKLPDNTIALGESIDLEFAIFKSGWVGGPGGISVSFPDLTLDNTVDSATSYNSDQGRVLTVRSATTFAEVAYLDSGASTTPEDASGSRSTPQHLSVAAETDDWPNPPSIPQRTLRLRIFPKEAGEFRVRYRYWLCNEDRTDDAGNSYCARYPKQDDTDNRGRDQQDWAVYEFTVTVVPKPEITSMGCAPDTVDIGVTVTCSPTYGGGDIDSRSWQAGYGLVGGNPSSGSESTFSTNWDFSGKQKVELRVCNDISGCVSGEAAITVNPDPTEPGEEEMMVDPDPEEEAPDDGGRVLISGLASQWAHSGYSPTDTMVQVRALPTPDMPTLEFTLYDQDGFAGGASDDVSPGVLVLALPDHVWVDYGGITAEMRIAGSWVDYTAAFERTLLALETASAGRQRTAAALGLIPAVGQGALTAAARLAWGVGEKGEAPVDPIFGASYANCVSQVTVPWLALAPHTTAVRISVPADLSTDDYVSLAGASIAAEGEDSEEPVLIQVHDLLDTGDAPPPCQSP